MANGNGAETARVLERAKALIVDLSGLDASEIIETSTFLELGFDSLFLTQLASAFQNAFAVKITFRQLYEELPTPWALADYIAHRQPARPAVAAADVVAPVSQVAEPQLLTMVESPAAAAAATAMPVAPMVARPPSAAGQQVSAGGPVSGAMQAILAEQLALMSRQLELLSGARRQVPLVAQLAAPVVQPQPAQPVVEARLQPVPVASPAPVVAEEKPQLPKGFVPQVVRDDKVLSERQRQHLARLVARYNAKTAGSKEHTQAHRAHFADPRTAAGFNRTWKEMVYQIVIERSSGCNLWDIDGNRYIDILNGFGPNFFGHSPPFIKEALKRQLDLGIEVGPQTPLAGEAAKLFCELTGMDRVSWVNTGSEAVQAAIRLSRTCTGRDKIVVFSGDYHGNFDEVLVRGTKNASGRRTLPLAPGIPMRAVGDVIVLDYGSEEALDLIRANAGSIAAVLVEPVQSRRPEFQPREFLHALRALTEQEGIVLVFDEVITGFRICPGGAQEYYGVKADLATYGKIIGGGMPIGVVAGRARFMDTFDGGQWQYGDDSFPAAGVTFFAGTFVRHPLAIAAAHASLSYLKAAGPSLQDGVNRRTTRMTGELNAFFEERGVKIRIPHFASQMFIRVSEENELATLFFYHLRDRGIHVLEGFPSYMTAAHSDEDIGEVVAAMKDSVLEMQDDGVLPRPAGEAVLPGSWVRRLPLTEGQHEILVASQMSEAASCAFNESDSIRIDGQLDTRRFTQAVEETLARHEAFRLRFDADGARQSIDPQAAFRVELVDLSTIPADIAEAEFEALLSRQARLPFDLSQGPIVRTFLVKQSDTTHVFVIYCHHIAFDGYSSELVVREVAERYAASAEGRTAELKPIAQFSEYVARSFRRRNDKTRAAALDHWATVFGDELPVPLELPTDRMRTPTRSNAGGTIHRELDKTLSEGVKAIARGRGVGMTALLLSSFASLLSRLSTQEDIVIGLPAAGQSALDVECAGYCVNMLPIRLATEYGKSFGKLAKETQQAVLDASEQQSAPLSEIIRSLHIPRDPSRLPLVEVVFNYSRYFAGLGMHDCKLTSRENRRRAILYDMFFNIVEADGRLMIDWDYASDLFDRSTIDRWTDHYVELLWGIIRDDARSLGELPLLPGQDDVVAIATQTH